jgi:hypothetical protein
MIILRVENGQIATPSHNLLMQWHLSFLINNNFLRYFRTRFANTRGMIMRSLRRAGRILAKILDSKIQGIILKMFRFAQHDNEKAGLESRPTRICNEKAGVPCTWAA